MSCNPQVHQRVNNSPPLGLSLIHTTPHQPNLILLKSVLILSYHASYFFMSDLLLSGFTHKIPAYIFLLSHACYALHSSHPTQFDGPNDTRRDTEVKMIPMANLLLQHPPQFQIIPSILFNKTLPQCEDQFHNRKRQDLSFVYFRL